MGRRNGDSGMQRANGSDRRGRAATAAYALVAAVLWALALYSLSPLSRPQPARLAARAVQVCDQGGR
jgi:hypothetical protein